MTYSRHSAPRYSSRGRFNSRYKQFITLIGVIIIGIIISSAMNAIPSKKDKSAVGKSVERTMPAQLN